MVSYFSILTFSSWIWDVVPIMFRIEFRVPCCNSTGNLFYWIIYTNFALEFLYMSLVLNSFISFVKSKKYIKIISVFVLLLIVFFSFRNVLLERIIKSKIIDFDKKYPAKMIVGRSHFTGFFTIILEDVVVIPDKKDTLFTASEIRLQLEFFPLFIGNIQFSQIELFEAFIHLVDKQHNNNYSFLLKGNAKSEFSDSTKNYSTCKRAIHFFSWPKFFPIYAWVNSY